MTSRDRFLKTLRFEKPDLPFVKTPGAWVETHQRWRREGWDGRALHEIFGTDLILNIGVYYGPAPQFQRQIVEEDERTITYINHEGILMREFKQYGGNSSMPQFLRFPVENEEDFERFRRERLGLNFHLRAPQDWKARVERLKNRTYPLMCFADRWGGFFGPLRNMMGLENLCLAFYDQPTLIERMMEERAESIIAITEKVLEDAEIDMFAFWEDMACKTGSLINPQMFRKFALKYYRRVCDFLRSRGVEFIFLDSDGDVRGLIPIWLDAGINGIWPCEVAAGMDVVELRREYGRDLLLIGGIDKRAVAAGGEAMRREVDRVMPLMEEGGYIPDLDHGAPPDISWPNMCEYMEYLLYRTGRGSTTHD